MTTGYSETACCDGCGTEVAHTDLDSANRCPDCRDRGRILAPRAWEALDEALMGNRNAYNYETRVCLAEHIGGAIRKHWVELAPDELLCRHRTETLTSGCATAATQGAIDAYKGHASKLADRWASMSFAAAKAEFDAL
jgi:DNA-directed RNA polymerase subunit RPC12/RpoP